MLFLTVTRVCASVLNCIFNLDDRVLKKVYNQQCRLETHSIDMQQINKEGFLLHQALFLCKDVATFSFNIWGTAGLFRFLDAW